MAQDIPGPPRSETFSVAELVADALRGRLRIPPFQRGLKWNRDDVSLLFDSLVRGYPIGSLLLWRGGPVPPVGPVQLGPVVVQHPSPDDVRWLVDGQQRVVSLVASLTRADVTDGRFDLWFDPDDNQFHPRPRGGPELHWIEVWRLLDAADLGEFLMSWAPGTPERRRAVLEAGRRIREYRVPCTVIEAADASSVRRVFQRLNNQGKALLADEIFDAWAEPGGTLAELAATTAQLGWGTLDPDVLLGAVLVNEGRDPTRRLTPEDEVELLSRAAGRLQPGLVQAIAFLRDDAAIPHVRLLPYNYVLQILPAFFVRHPEASARTRTLLVRWVWRILQSVRPGDPSILRAAARAVSAATATEDERIGSLLAATPRVGSAWVFSGDRFRSDSGPARIALVALATLRPLDLTTGLAVDVNALLQGPQGIARIFATGGSSVRLTDSIANRVLHPPGMELSGAVGRWLYEVGPEAEPLQSHAITPKAAKLLMQFGDVTQFLEFRGEVIERLVERHFQKFAAWDQDDRPNLRELFAS